MKKIAVVGTGIWGTALALTAARAGNQVLCWAREQEVVDAINQKLGAKSIYFGAQSQGVNHFIKRGLKSPSYTSSWAELLKVS